MSIVDVVVNREKIKPKTYVHCTLYSIAEQSKQQKPYHDPRYQWVLLTNCTPCFGKTDQISQNDLFVINSFIFRGYTRQVFVLFNKLSHELHHFRHKKNLSKVSNLNVLIPINNTVLF